MSEAHLELAHTTKHCTRTRVRNEELGPQVELLGCVPWHAHTQPLPQPQRHRSARDPFIVKFFLRGACRSLQITKTRAPSP
jgi:hypothetical protein